MSFTCNVETATGREQGASGLNPQDITLGCSLAREAWPAAKVIDQDAIDGLAAADAEIADICTPGHTHGSLALQALTTGRHALVQNLYAILKRSSSN